MSRISRRRILVENGMAALELRQCFIGRSFTYDRLAASVIDALDGTGRMRRNIFSLSRQLRASVRLPDVPS